MRKLNNYFWSSYRRNKLDKLQEKYQSLNKGIVIDIGGRDRGQYRKPKTKVEKWIFADIEEKHNPDIQLDVANMSDISSNSIDTINAIELFEHVEKIDEGLAECYRILKPDGVLILSVPFLYAIHADPYDFQRWTLYKWKTKLALLNFKLEKIEIMGYFFTVVNDMLKVLIKSLPFGIRHLLYLLFPIFDLLNLMDKTKWIQNHKKLGNFHGGYFLIIRK